MATPDALPMQPLPLRLRAGRRRAVIHGLTVAGLLFMAYLFVFIAPKVQSVGYDAWAYWNVHQPHPYTVPIGGLGSFPYSPPMVLAFDPVGALPWWIFLYLWLALLVATIIWLGGRRAAVILAFPPVALELYHGNIHLLLAAAVVLGFSHPWSWSFVLLTKATSGVGLLWFAVRREWGSLVKALAATSVIAAVSFVIAPGLWREWLQFLTQDPAGMPGGPSVPVPLWLRLALAAALVTWGARTDRRWTVAVAACIALPVLWLAGFAMLAALAPELRRHGHVSTGDGSNAPSPATADPLTGAYHA